MGTAKGGDKQRPIRCLGAQGRPRRPATLLCTRRRCAGPVSGAWVIHMSVAIVDYGSGNLHSAAKAFERAARDCGTGQSIIVTRDPQTVAAADRVVLPGV